MQYAAFISYAHADEKTACRVHSALETYPLPKNMKTEGGRKLSPIFRDVTELTAHHCLSEKIKEAVERSKYLIVLCSPAAKQSSWVNEEIQLFRKIHGESSILCALIEGTPETSFPPALLEDGREPLAADISNGREGFRFGITQLAASMLGVGLDTLLQRDAGRRQARVRVITGLSIAFAAFMGGVSWVAVDARHAAETSRTEAEKLVEFMIKDLKDDLEPVGRLDILDGVGERVVEYYDRIPVSEMDDDRLARQARARHILGQVALDQGNNNKAILEINKAYQLTKMVLQRNANDPTAIFAHAQSEYWMGQMLLLRDEHENALPYWQNYSALGLALFNIDPKNTDWIMEAAWGANNLGLVQYRLGSLQEARHEYERALHFMTLAKNNSPESNGALIEISNALAGLSNIDFALEQYTNSQQQRLQQIDMLEVLIAKNPNNRNYQYRLILAKLKLGALERMITKSCHVENTETRLNALLGLIRYDRTNYDWQYNYVDYSSQFLNACQSSFSKEQLGDQVDVVLDFAAKNLKRGDLEAELQALARLKTG